MGAYEDKWSRLQGRLKVIEETIQELDALGVRGPFGIPARELGRNVRESISWAIQHRSGDPDRMMNELDSLARDLYWVAEGALADKAFDDLMRELGYECYISPGGYDPRRNTYTLLEFPFIPADERPRARAKHVIDCGDMHPDICAFDRVIPFIADRGCAYFDRRDGVVLDPRNPSRVHRLRDMVAGRLEQLKSRLGID